MDGLPGGTVTLLFSDVAGSTVLLSRLGPAYADAMDGQRKVLRSASTSFGGTEMGTEGDGFFVAFPTAPAAVAAATEAQRELEAYPWPQGERVRVRMGIHTGNPTVHAGGYVGMDVHRAARIAGAAHGGQVVMSDTTAHLVVSGLPDGADLRDLGTHRLKDLPAPERLFQLRLPGLQAEFAPLKSLGAASSLPAPVTPLVGRDGYLADLDTLLGSRVVRLVTLTGPGGSGKTRLAIAMGKRLIESFPDGVYFVPLAAVTGPAAMWATIAEALDVPVERRAPPAIFEYVAHRSALFILDNLEQLEGADSVVAQLLTEARQVVVVATSRRPLHVLGEHEHAVQPLELPVGDGLAEVARTGAVQLFVQQAASVRSSFALSSANAADVAAICRRLDGLPLAIELAAARTKMLSPHALLARLDRALDISAAGNQGPIRQRTLRDTIAWSYNLLTPPLQSLFRRLGVFVGGADLDAIGALAVARDEGDPVDPLDLVASLVDASLATVTESSDGEPRIGMLKTMRAFANDQLLASGEHDAVRERHARHYLQVAEGLSRLVNGDQHREARARFETEIDNFREALEWTSGRLGAGDGESATEPLALRLCVALDGLWFASGYYSEERIWMDRAIQRAHGGDSPELALCLTHLARVLQVSGSLDKAREHANAGVVMWRRLDKRDGRLSSALEILASIEADRGRPAIARPLFEEALVVARAVEDKTQLGSALMAYARFVGGSEHDLRASLELETEALMLARELGHLPLALRCQHNMACSLRLLGRTDEAMREMRSLIATTLDLDRPMRLSEIAEDFAAILAESGEPEQAVRLFGAAAAQRDRLRTPLPPTQASEIADAIALTHEALSTGEWDEAYREGRRTLIEDALAPHAAGD